MKKIPKYHKETNQQNDRGLTLFITPGRYVGIPDEEDDGIPFEEKMAELLSKVKEQMAEENKLNEEIEKQLKNIGFEL